MTKDKKPKVKLVGENGNIFNLLGIAAKALRKSGLHEEAKKMSNEVIHASNYSEALGIITNYVDVR